MSTKTLSVDPEQKVPKAVKLTQLLDVMKVLMDDRFTGYIKVNFSQGGIGRVEKFEEILK